jgi:hypothetical protein
MKGVNRQESCRVIFNELNILTVTSLYIYEVLSYFQECNTYSTRNSNFQEYDTRKDDDFHVPFCNSSFFKKSVNNIGFKLLNKMPGEIKTNRRF